MLYNNITTLTNDNQLMNKNLEMLDMWFSEKLLSIDDCAFCGFENLQYLHITHCPKLQNIHENAFGALNGKKMPKLREFSIYNCNITTLPEALLDWKSLENLEIQNNPFFCNCSMAWLINDNKAGMPKNIDKLRNYSHCNGPEELKKKSFNEVAKDKSFCKISDQTAGLNTVSSSTSVFTHPTNVYSPTQQSNTTTTHVNTFHELIRSEWALKIIAFIFGITIIALVLQKLRRHNNNKRIYFKFGDEIEKLSSSSKY